ncbi:unnamed protein product [Protopolystoma xenopodis]|uniref:Uncharacterized protein n=1 Tax=Protopolystoma xenopodis TaxID=117903 RepID=A0A448XQD8_9PLAT|nr:unnamed protein product [Protopolystoma xenopodis]
MPMTGQTDQSDLARKICTIFHLPLASGSSSLWLKRTDFVNNRDNCVSCGLGWPQMWRQEGLPGKLGCDAKIAHFGNHAQPPETQRAGVCRLRQSRDVKACVEEKNMA